MSNQQQIKPKRQSSTIVSNKFDNYTSILKKVKNRDKLIEQEQQREHNETNEYELDNSSIRGNNFKDIQDNVSQPIRTEKKKVTFKENERNTSSLPKEKSLLRHSVTSSIDFNPEDINVAKINKLTVSKVSNNSLQLKSKPSTKISNNSVSEGMSFPLKSKNSKYIKTEEYKSGNKSFQKKISKKSNELRSDLYESYNSFDFLLIFF